MFSYAGNMVLNFKPLHRRWQDNEDGATAVEFSLVAIPFMFTIIGIIELALMFMASSVLEGAVNDTTRLIRTGQVQNAEDATPEEFFQQALCDSVPAFLDCREFQYQVYTLDSFSEADDTEPEFDEDGNLQDTEFDVGGSNQIVLVRVTYMYQLITPLIGDFFSDFPNNKRLIMATSVFETEPYEFGSL